jgi:hypothetical protein
MPKKAGNPNAQSNAAATPDSLVRISSLRISFRRKALPTRCRPHLVALLALVFFLSAGRSLAGPDAVAVQFAGQPAFGRRIFDVYTAAGLTNLITAVEALLQLSEAEEQRWQAAQTKMRAATPLPAMSQAELKKFFSEPDGLTTRRERRGWMELGKLARAALETNDPGHHEELTGALLEITAAIQNNRRPPVPARLDLIQLPWAFWDHWQHPIARGRTTASNLEPVSEDERDSSRIDPAPTTFWRRPASISGADLYHGFGRSELPVLEDKMWIYDGPKTGYGSNPGFEVESGALRAKVKFAETASEPFTARVFAALGYHVEPTDHAERLKIKYDRRLFREFHLRKEIRMRCMVFGFVPVHTIKLQRRFDPFDYISGAVLKDGSRWTGAELKARLFYRPKIKHAEELPENFRAEVEQQIDYLVTTAANVQIKDETMKSIGPWDFGGLGHEHRRELRGAGLLAAWLGWFDSRFENTRLKICHTNGHEELAHYFSDVGGGLGRGTGIFSARGELPNQFDWTFTRGTKTSNGQPSFQIIGFRPIDNTPAFEQMTMDDARWMARLIAQLTEKQIIQALVASGFDTTQVKLYTEKLVSRRDRAIRDLGLEGEIALLRPEGVDEGFSYDPEVDGRVWISPRAGERLAAPSASWVVAKGRIVSR